MGTGSTIGRQWLVIAIDGTPLADWGDGLYQDIVTGTFRRLLEKDISHTITDSDLINMKLAGQILGFDDQVVNLRLLPDRPTRTLE
jgi:hypothetical protein